METFSAEYFIMEGLGNKKAFSLFIHFHTWEFYGIVHKLKLLGDSCSLYSGIYPGFRATIYYSIQVSQVTQHHVVHTTPLGI